MKIFISWSGDRSKALAQAVYDWLPLVLHYTEPWMSDADIEAGERWGQAVAKELEACNYGVICLTRENLSSPWVLFETGALAKLLQTSRVTPLLLDLEFRDLGGPLTQFQAKKADTQGLNDIIQSINRNSDQAITEARAKQLFEALWPDFEKRVKEIPNPAAPTKQHTRPQQEILEELVLSIRSLESRFRDLSDDGLRPSARARRQLQPMLVHEFTRKMAGKTGDPIALLVWASAYRDDYPWLYELALETYRLLQAGAMQEARSSLRRFQRAVDVIRKNSLTPDALDMDLPELHLLTRQMDLTLNDQSIEESEQRLRPLDYRPKRPDQ